MPFFIRKSFSLGPLRLNLSQHGIGYSVGVKGARIGQQANGTPYVYGGRYGLYYRERFGSHRPGSVSSGPLDFFLIALGLALAAAIVFGLIVS